VFQKKGSRDEMVEIPPARKPRYFEKSAYQCAEKRIGRGPYTVFTNGGHAGKTGT